MGEAGLEPAIGFRQDRFSRRLSLPRVCMFVTLGTVARPSLTNVNHNFEHSPIFETTRGNRTLLYAPVMTWESNPP